MSNYRYKVVLRRITRYSSTEEDMVIEIKCGDDIKKAMKELSPYRELLMYLGPYEIGRVNTYMDKYLQFDAVMKIKSYSELGGSGYLLTWERLESILDKEITLEEFVKSTISEYYQVEVINNPLEAWYFIQNDWRNVCRVQRIMNQKLADSETISKEEKVIFIKRKS